MDFRWLVVVPASIVLGFLFDWLNVPAAWILAAIVASGAAALISQRDMPVNKHFYGISRGFIGIMGRSEEHTSELQSRGHLVCRLLLEIKNQPKAAGLNQDTRNENSAR